MQHLKTILYIITISFALSSCSSLYFGPISHVKIETSAKFKSSDQKSNLTGADNSLANTYDEEIIYDDKGNIIKIIQTEYVDRLSNDKKYIEWRTQYQIIGGKLVPKLLSVNNVPYVEVDWEVLQSKHEGPVTQDTVRQFSNFVNMGLWGSAYLNLKIDHDVYPVSFTEDKQFVEKIGTLSGGSLSNSNYLTLGYNNIAIKRFRYDYEALAQGLSMTYQTSNASTAAAIAARGQKSSIQFDYEWKVIADKICQTNTTFTSKTLYEKMIFKTNSDYNPSGERTKEVWTVTQESQFWGNKSPLVIYEQNLTY